jgi:5-oxoprolinase (ATP-hydrolysing) subunit B
MRILTAGSGALLVCLDRPEQVTGLYHDLLRDPPEGFIEAIPAAETVMVLFDPTRTAAPALASRLEFATTRANTNPEPPEPTKQPPSITIPVTYDGPDLDDVARSTNLTVEEVVRRHEAGEYIVAFCGFAPGFGYLAGLDPALHLPRRPAPRTRVPAGSIAISDRFTSVYPHTSPGGWHLLGRTTMAMWDVERQPPSLLSPGTRVRFERVTP